jgi:hypothetical protein
MASVSVPIVAMSVIVAVAVVAVHVGVPCAVGVIVSHQVLFYAGCVRKRSGGAQRKSISPRLVRYLEVEVSDTRHWPPAARAESVKACSVSVLLGNLTLPGCEFIDGVASDCHD